MAVLQKMKENVNVAAMLRSSRIDTWMESEERVLMAELEQVGDDWEEIQAALEDRSVVELKAKAKQMKLECLEGGVEIPAALKPIAVMWQNRLIVGDVVAGDSDEVSGTRVSRKVESKPVGRVRSISPVNWSRGGVNASYPVRAGGLSIEEMVRSGSYSDSS